MSKANTALEATPPKITQAQARDSENMALNLLQRASDALDLSLLPEALRQGLGIEAALLLKEVLDRMLLPPLDVISTAEMVATANKESVEQYPQTRPPFRGR